MLEKSVLLEDKIRINHLLNSAFIKSVFYTSGQISQIFLKLLDINPQWSLGFAVDFCDHMKGGK
jgi:hypothetical protein